jgi:choline dehydrogenase
MGAQVDPIRTVDIPTRIVHGRGALAWLGRTVGELGVRRPLVVTDAGLVEAGLVARALAQLTDAVVFADVRANPDIELIDRGAALYRERGCDGLVAIGGGSPIDTAKSIGVVARHGGSIAGYEWGRDPIKRRVPPLVAIPTTAGTGSEVTLWAVVTDPGRRIKFNVGGTPLIATHVAIIDPELALALPPGLTAATGMDALAHAVECYTCDYHQPFTDAVALHAIELVGAWLEAAAADGTRIDARTGMAHAATLGGLAYGTESAGAAHAMSQSAGGVHDCSHGALTARLLGPVCAFNVPACPERYARVAQALGVDVSGLDATDAALAGVAEIARLADAVGIPAMTELGFTREEIPLLARLAFDDPQTIGNPREIVAGDYEDIYRAAFGHD